MICNLLTLNHPLQYLALKQQCRGRPDQSAALLLEMGMCKRSDNPLGKVVQQQQAPATAPPSTPPLIQAAVTGGRPVTCATMTPRCIGSGTCRTGVYRARRTTTRCLHTAAPGTRRTPAPTSSTRSKSGKGGSSHLMGRQVGD